MSTQQKSQHPSKPIHSSSLWLIRTQNNNPIQQNPNFKLSQQNPIVPILFLIIVTYQNPKPKSKDKTPTSLQVEASGKEAKVVQSDSEVAVNDRWAGSHGGGNEQPWLCQWSLTLLSPTSPSLILSLSLSLSLMWVFCLMNVLLIKKNGKL